MSLLEIPAAMPLIIYYPMVPVGYYIQRQKPKLNIIEKIILYFSPAPELSVPLPTTTPQAGPVANNNI